MIALRNDAWVVVDGKFHDFLFVLGSLSLCCLVLACRVLHWERHYQAWSAVAPVKTWLMMSSGMSIKLVSCCYGKEDGHILYSLLVMPTDWLAIPGIYAIPWFFFHYSKLRILAVFDRDQITPVSMVCDLLSYQRMYCSCFLCVLVSVMCYQRHSVASLSEQVLVVSGANQRLQSQHAVLKLVQSNIRASTCVVQWRSIPFILLLYYVWTSQSCGFGTAGL